MSDRILVVSYSNTGTSRRIANLLASQFHWQQGEVLEHTSRAGFTGTMRCIADSVFRRCPDVRYRGPDPADFDTVVLIAPIWFYQLAGPMRTFVRRYADELRRVAVVSAMGGGGATNASAEIDHILGVAPILATSFIARDVDDGSYAPRLEAFGNAIKSDGGNGKAVRPVLLSTSSV